MPLKTIFLIGLGGGLGSIFRYLISVYLMAKTTTIFPIGTFFVNLAGCFLIGLIYGLAVRESWLSEDLRFLLATGFCGGFTTFSTFSFESFELLKLGEYNTVVLYIGGSIVLGILLASVGFWLGK